MLVLVENILAMLNTEGHGRLPSEPREWGSRD